ncbi:MAG: hypothetical protein QW303_01345 [Nitrososphaerota archaeon]
MPCGGSISGQHRGSFDTLTVSSVLSSLVPYANKVINLGSNTLRWANLFVGTIHSTYVNSTEATFENIYISGGGNQIAFVPSSNMTLSVATPASSRDITLADPGYDASLTTEKSETVPVQFFWGSTSTGTYNLVFTRRGTVVHVKVPEMTGTNSTGGLSSIKVLKVSF